MASSPTALRTARPRRIASSPTVALFDGSCTAGAPSGGTRRARAIEGPQLLVAAGDLLGDLNHVLNGVAADFHRVGLQHGGISLQLAQGKHGEKERPETEEANALFLRGKRQR